MASITNIFYYCADSTSRIIPGSVDTPSYHDTPGRFPSHVHRTSQHRRPTRRHRQVTNSQSSTSPKHPTRSTGFFGEITEEDQRGCGILASIGCHQPPPCLWFGHVLLKRDVVWLHGITGKVAYGPMVIEDGNVQSTIYPFREFYRWIFPYKII